MKSKILAVAAACMMLLSTAYAEPTNWSVNYIPGAPSSISNQVSTVRVDFTGKYYYVTCTSSSVASGVYSPYVMTSAEKSSNTFSFAYKGSYTYPPNYTTKILSDNVSFTAKGNKSIKISGYVSWCYRQAKKPAYKKIRRLL